MTTFFSPVEKPLPKIIVIVGPTASGKTDLAIKLAQKFNGEIVSADSRQVYKGMDIGTGKAPLARSKFKVQGSRRRTSNSELLTSGGIPHYLLDVASPRQTFTVAQYQKLGSVAIKKILSKDKLPIIVGGTGFYIDALLYNYNLPSVKQNPKLRRALEKKSTEELFNKLKSLDPGRAETIDRHNKVRLIRAFEIILATKKPVPKLTLWRVQGEKPLYDFLKIGVKLPDSELKKQIEKRVDGMIEKGLVDEVRWLIKKYGEQQIAFDAIGYKEIIAFLKKEMSLEKSASSIKSNTISFAKRQMTWFRKDKKIK